MATDLMGASGAKGSTLCFFLECFSPPKKKKEKGEMKKKKRKKNYFRSLARFPLSRSFRAPPPLKSPLPPSSPRLSTLHRHQLTRL